MQFLQIHTYVKDIPLLCYNDEQLEADRKRIYCTYLGLSADQVRVCYWFVYDFWQIN
jgi:hypothetical protein